MMMKVTLKISKIGCTKRILDTLRSLKLKRINDVAFVDPTIATQVGRVAKIKHLVRIEEVQDVKTK